VLPSRILAVRSYPVQSTTLSKGKIERFWQVVASSFVPELTARPVETIEELNVLFGAWLEQGYHHWVNRETGETPAARFARGLADIRLADPLRLAEVFLWQEPRDADRTGRVSLQGNHYEIDPRLAGRKVDLRPRHGPGLGRRAEIRRRPGP
jgi:putative transposase